MSADNVVNLMPATPERDPVEKGPIEKGPIEKGMFDLVPCGLVICDAQGMVLRANAFFRNLSGLAPEAFEGAKAFNQFLTRPSRFIFNAQLLPQLIHGGQVREVALDISGPDGATIAVLINANLDRANNQQHFAVFPALDRRIHERELLKAQKEVIQSRNYLQLAEKLAHVGHWRSDLTTKDVVWSPEIYTITGLDPKMHTPKMGDGAVVYHEDDRNDVTRIIDNAIRTGEGFTFRKRLIQHGTGEIRHVQASGICEYNAHGVVTGLFGVFQDVTKMVTAEADLAHSEKRYRLLADGANDIITVFDLAGTFEYLSPGITRILGYDPDAMLGRNVSEIIHPDDYPMTQAAYYEYVVGKAWEHPPHIRYRALHNNGSYLWVEAHPMAIFDAGGQRVIAFQDVVRDISEQKITEDALAQASIEANAAADAKAQFLATMSHELRTPLTSIIGYSSLLRDLLDAPDLIRHSQRIHSAGQGLLALINDILDHSKLEAGQLALDIAPCSVPDLVADVVDMLTLQAEGKGLILTISGAEAIPAALMADEIRLRQILLNLISNAVKFTAKGGVSLHMEMRGGTKAPRLLVAVRDSGTGISAQNQQRLFQRFSQVHKDANLHGGTGLGLLICKQLTDLMGGTIGVNSIEGEGATFWFEIPVTVGTASISDKPIFPDLPDQTGRILLADDNAANLDLIGTVLVSLGHHVDKVGNGAEALQACLEKPYDIILMDVNMPVMDGLMATRSIRTTCLLNLDTPIIALTASGDSQLQACLAAGMNDLVDKPVNQAALMVAVASWLYQSPQKSQPSQGHAS